jgi:hypothetical protein
LLKFKLELLILYTISVFSCFEPGLARSSDWPHFGASLSKTILDFNEFTVLYRLQNVEQVKPPYRNKLLNFIIPAQRKNKNKLFLKLKIDASITVI